MNNVETNTLHRATHIVNSQWSLSSHNGHCQVIIFILW